MLGELEPFGKSDISKIFFIFFILPPNSIFIIKIFIEIYYSYRDALKQQLLRLKEIEFISKILSKLQHIIKILLAAIIEKKTLMYFAVFMVFSFAMLYSFIYGDEEEKNHSSEYRRGFVERLFGLISGGGGKSEKESLKGVEIKEYEDLERSK